MHYIISILQILSNHNVQLSNTTNGLLQILDIIESGLLPFLNILAVEAVSGALGIREDNLPTLIIPYSALIPLGLIGIEEGAP